MHRLMTFFLGMVTGAVLLYGALHFHVIQAQDGMHLVKKIDPKLKATYVDIRGFTIADWRQHTEIAAALVRADKAALMQNAASGALQQSLDQWLEK